MWGEYIQQFDRMIQESLTVCARASLRAVWQSLHGTGIMSPAPLIKVSIGIHAKKVIGEEGPVARDNTNPNFFRR